MKANGFSIDQLESDFNVRLPPRKRLLAGLKKQCESASSSSSFSNEFGAHLRDLLSVDSKSAHLSPEQIVEASRSAALAAAEVAVAAKAAAVEKAAIAAKAAATAKSALELVASVSKKRTHDRIQRKNKPKKHVPVTKNRTHDRIQRKNKPKKHVPVKLLYKGPQRIENHERDEELARKLHRAMNSSPRISKKSVNSNSKVQCCEKQRKLPVLGKAKVSGEGLPFVFDTDVKGADGECLEPVRNIGSSDELEKNALMPTDYFGNEKVQGEGDHEIMNSTRKRHHEFEARGVIGGKKARIKKKKLSLSLCSKRDREKPKEKPESDGFPSTEKPTFECTAESMPSLAVESRNEVDMSIEAVPIWNCNECTTPQCFAESKILHPLCSNPTVTTVSTMIKVDQ
ncbi:uncharacterized protein LOC143886700 [Tasmannia lanceolata]|uniref:uncharacterized protein LOC143886700 n=1 Tax=Tasmannia lanceolata TaxID=3420 RepID=UPI004063515C